jgi:uncharacterized protein
VRGHKRAVAWTKDDPEGFEFAEVSLSETRLSATGVAIGSDPIAYRLDYSLVTSEGFVTTALRVEARGQGFQAELDLQRRGDGRWRANGRGLHQLAEALDCDLGLSPLTNSLPVLRHGLLQDTGSVELVMAWVSVPDLGVHASRQRYTGLGGGMIRFDSLDDSFTAEIAFDEDGLVVDYPGIARRLSGRSG